MKCAYAPYKYNLTNDHAERTVKSNKQCRDGNRERASKHRIECDGMETFGKQAQVSFNRDSQSMRIALKNAQLYTYDEAANKQKTNNNK